MNRPHPDIDLSNRFSESVISGLYLAFLICLMSGYIHYTYAQGLPEQKNPDHLSDGAAIWQGFQMHWTYNHRLNRLGNFIETQQDSAENYKVNVWQTAATGLGEDKGQFVSNFTFVHIPGVRIRQEQIDFAFSAQRDQKLSITKRVKFTPQDEGTESSTVIPLLSGYDLVAAGSPHKIRTLEIQISDAEYHEDLDYGWCEITATLNMDCKSLECNRFEKIYHYTLQVGVLLLIGGENIHETRNTFVTGYSWDRRNEIPRSSSNEEITGIPDDRFNRAVLGIRGFSINLDKAHWFIDWINSITPTQYNPGTGRYRFLFEFFVRNWRDGMRRNAANPVDSKFSFRQAGGADLRGTISMVQFERGCTQFHQQSDTLFWMGNKTSPDSGDAVNRGSFILSSNCSEASESQPADSN